MTSTDDDNPFPDGTAVLVRFPRHKAEEQGDRDAWPYLPGVIEQRCAEDEWQIIVQSPELEDGTAPPPDTPDEDLFYPLVYRDRRELRTAPPVP